MNENLWHLLLLKKQLANCWTHKHKVVSETMVCCPQMNCTAVGMNWHKDGKSNKQQKTMKDYNNIQLNFSAMFHHSDPLGERPQEHRRRAVW